MFDRDPTIKQLTTEEMTSLREYINHVIADGWSILHIDIMSILAIQVNTDYYVKPPTIDAITNSYHELADHVDTIIKELDKN